MNSPLHVLWVGQQAPNLSALAFGHFELQACLSLDLAARALADAPHDALVVQTDMAGADCRRCCAGRRCRMQCWTRRW
jgi:hypothetical protein